MYCSGRGRIIRSNKPDDFSIIKSLLSQIKLNASYSNIRTNFLQFITLGPGTFETVVPSDKRRIGLTFEMTAGATLQDVCIRSEYGGIICIDRLSNIAVVTYSGYKWETQLKFEVGVRQSLGGTYNVMEFLAVG